MTPEESFYPKLNPPIVIRDDEMAVTSAEVLGDILGDEMVTLYVGEERRKFFIHKNVICKVDFFRKGFTGGFQEATKGTMDLPEDEPDTISYFLHCLYGSSLPKPSGDHVKDFHNYWSLYLFAEKICVTVLLNPTMDMIREVTTPVHIEIDRFLAHALEAYKKTCTDSPLRLFAAHYAVFVAMHLHQGKGGICGPMITGQPLKEIWKVSKEDSDLFEDLVSRMQVYSLKYPRDQSPHPAGIGYSDSDYDDGNNCFFHLHPEGEECSV